jgi:hypothetical protein
MILSLFVFQSLAKYCDVVFKFMIVFYYKNNTYNKNKRALLKQSKDVLIKKNLD